MTRIYGLLKLYSRKAIITILILILLCIVISGTLCAIRTFTLEEGIAHFSFEYHSRYSLHTCELGDILGERTTIIMHTPKVGEGIAPEVHEAEIWIHIRQADSSESNSTEALESSLSWGSQLCKDFQLIERSDVTVDGIQGEQVVSSHNGVRVIDYHFGEHIVRTPVVGRIVYFDYNGKVWRIMVEGHKEQDDTWKADFEYLLETFQFLE